MTPLHQCGSFVIETVTRNPDIQFNIERLPRITMKADGTVYLNENWVPASELRWQKVAGKQVVFLADTRLSFGAVRILVRTLQQRGIARMILIASGERGAIDQLAADVTRNLGAKEQQDIGRKSW